jgi:hypothetical protein
MTVYTTRQLLTGAALAGVLALAAACSGASPSMSPTAPTASASSATASANFSPNPSCGGTDQPPCTCEQDPTQPACVDLGSGRFTGGGFQINDGDIKVTRGFTIHCDNILTNNLEINWAGGNNFHIDKESLITVSCTKPSVPNPPKADVSRIEATSPGTCNGLPASIRFILEDRGEPGAGNDRAAFFITGGCNLTLTERPIDGGNIQAHFDQPHK